MLKKTKRRRECISERSLGGGQSISGSATLQVGGAKRAVQDALLQGAPVQLASLLLTENWNEDRANCAAVRERAAAAVRRDRAGGVVFDRGAGQAGSPGLPVRER